MQRLSSGLRINSASDDAAGLAISENMRARVRSMNQAVRNANDGVSLLQTAEGALNETGNILTRMRELATQAATGTVSSEQRTYIDNEFTQLKAEINRIASATQFNGSNLLDGTSTTSFQIGPGSTTNDSIAVTIAAADTGTIGVSTSSVNTQAGATAALNAIDNAIKSVSSSRGSLGAVQNRLQSTIANLQVAVENTSAAESRIRDVDVAAETAALTRAQVLSQAGTAILSQANQAPQTALSLLR
jgi:flagellin